MGINGLLRVLSPLLVPEDQVSTVTTTPFPVYNIRQFSGKVLAIDASGWLHRACYKCVERLVKASEDGRIDKYCEATIANYVVGRCEELLKFGGIRKIYLVFDGKRCPLKAVTNKERDQKRINSLKEAKLLEKQGRRDLALEKYKSCVKIENWMAFSVAKKVKQTWNNQYGSAPVQCVFSPYEADAQLAKLCISGLADAVVTEDSDILVYSAACGVPFPIIFKLERDGNCAGKCDVISMDWLLSPEVSILSNYPKNGYSSLRRVLLVPPITVDEKGKSTSFPGKAMLNHLQALVSREKRNKGSGARMFVQACVLAGCDYCPSQVQGIGLVTAFKYIKENAHRKPDTRFSFVLKSLPSDKVMQSPLEASRTSKDKNKTDIIDQYELLLSKSECVFYFHCVKDVIADVNVPLLIETEGNATLTDENERISLPCTKRFEDKSFLGDVYASTIVSQSISSILTQSQTFDNETKTGNTEVKKRKPLTPFVAAPVKRFASVDTPDDEWIHDLDQKQCRSKYFSARESFLGPSILSSDSTRTSQSDGNNIVTPTASELNSQVESIIDLCESDNDIIDEVYSSSISSYGTSLNTLQSSQRSFVKAQTERNKFADSRKNVKSKRPFRITAKSKSRMTRLTDFWKPN